MKSRGRGGLPDERGGAMTHRSNQCACSRPVTFFPHFHRRGLANVRTLKAGGRRFSHSAVRRDILVTPRKSSASGGCPSEPQLGPSVRPHPFRTWAAQLDAVFRSVSRVCSLNKLSPPARECKGGLMFNVIG
ncbi:hypothetical protein chiPu_0009868 [Chiloscyllium punctatum]|uniref:Uncharacterized protein n=1 Tax=Chiloscyllium punctatum TaxID=137246 RepID=A0A401SLZ4_CHIPU|nr:hypothetical protein [Chiloscyllium punctatum]